MAALRYAVMLLLMQSCHAIDQINHKVGSNSQVKSSIVESRKLQEQLPTDILEAETEATIITDASTCSSSCCQMIEEGDAATGDESYWIAEKGGIIEKLMMGPVGHEVSFLHNYRSSVESGPSQYLNPGCFIEGYQYEVKFAYKLLNAVGQPYLCTTNHYGQRFSCPLFSIKLVMPDGSGGYEISVNQAEGQFDDHSVGTFKEYRSVFTANSDLVNAQSALMVIRGLPVHHVLLFDDVTLTPYMHGHVPHFEVPQFKEWIDPSCEGQCCELVKDGDAELVSAPDSWDAIGGGMIDIFPNGANGGTKSYRSFARQDINVGPGQAINKNCLVPGHTYKFTAWVMLQNSAGYYACTTARWNEYGTCPLMSIGYRSLDGTNHWILVPNLHGTEIPGWVANRFNLYSALFTVPDDYDPTQVIDAYFMFRGQPPLANLYYDDVSLIPFLHQPTEISAPEGSCYEGECEGLVVNGDVSDPDISAWIPFEGGTFTSDSDNGIRHYGRPYPFSGPGQNITEGCLQPGRQFEVTAMLRTLYPTGQFYSCNLHSPWGTLAMCPLFTISYTNQYGQQKMFEGRTQIMVVNWSAVVFNKYQVVFEVPDDFAGATDMYWAFRGPPKNHIIQVKDVVFKPYCHAESHGETIYFPQSEGTLHIYEKTTPSPSVTPTVADTSSPTVKAVGTAVADSILGSYPLANIVQGSNDNSFIVNWISGDRPTATGWINAAGTQGSVTFPDERIYTFSYRSGVIYWDDHGSFTSTNTWTKGSSSVSGSTTVTTSSQGGTASGSTTVTTVSGTTTSSQGGTMSGTTTSSQGGTVSGTTTSSQGGTVYGTTTSSLGGTVYGTTTASQGTVSGTTTSSQGTASGTTTASQGTVSGTTTASQGTVSGTTTASQGTASGTTTASQGTISGSTTSGQMVYDESSFVPLPVCVGPIKFRSAIGSFDGKVSTAESISVSGGDWDKIHTEITSRTLIHGDSFAVQGNKQQVGAGLCVETCDLGETASIRFNHNCVGFYGDNANMMLATNISGVEYTIPADNKKGTKQGFTYDEANNCVTHVGPSSSDCIPLPGHFKGKPLRAIGQVWNSATATISA